MLDCSIANISSGASNYNDQLSVGVSKQSVEFSLSLADHPGEFSLASYLTASCRGRSGVSNVWMRSSFYCFRELADFVDAGVRLLSLSFL